MKRKEEEENRNHQQKQIIEFSSWPVINAALSDQVIFLIKNLWMKALRLKEVEIINKKPISQEQTQCFFCLFPFTVHWF